MPARNIVKFYIQNSYYHLYSRGVEKRIIFQDDFDYKVFLNYLKEYLSPIPSAAKLQGPTLQLRDLHGKYFDKIKLIAFSLMPNHFHLLVWQKDKDSIKKFMQSLLTRYSMYFNKKYKRVGSLFQSRYKATNVVNNDYLLDISHYIHNNKSNYSSYTNYLGVIHTPWLKTNHVLDYFKESTFIKHNKIPNYKFFVEEFKYQSEESFDLG